MKRPKIDHVAAILELRASGIEPVDEYPGVTSKPFRVRCLKPSCPARTEPFTTYLSQVRALGSVGDSGDVLMPMCCQLWMSIGWTVELQDGAW